MKMLYLFILMIYASASNVEITIDLVVCGAKTYRASIYWSALIALMCSVRYIVEEFFQDWANHDSNHLHDRRLNWYSVGDGASVILAVYMVKPGDAWQVYRIR